MPQPSGLTFFLLHAADDEHHFRAPTNYDVFGGIAKLRFLETFAQIVHFPHNDQIAQRERLCVSTQFFHMVSDHRISLFEL